MRSLVISIFLYACELWTLTIELQRRIQAMETRCYCKILYISYKDHVTNEEVRAKIQQEGTVKGGRRQGRQKKRWEGNISEMDRPVVRQVPEGSGEQGKMEEACEIICGAPTTLALRDR